MAVDFTRFENSRFCCVLRYHPIIQSCSISTAICQNRERTSSSSIGRGKDTSVLSDLKSNRGWVFMQMIIFISSIYLFDWPIILSDPPDEMCSEEFFCLMPDGVVVKSFRSDPIKGVDTDDHQFNQKDAENVCRSNKMTDAGGESVFSSTSGRSGVILCSSRITVDLISPLPESLLANSSGGVERNEQIEEREIESSEHLVLSCRYEIWMRWENNLSVKSARRYYFNESESIFVSLQ